MYPFIHFNFIGVTLINMRIELSYNPAITLLGINLKTQKHAFAKICAPLRTRYLLPRPLPRLHFLQSVVAEHQQFDELLLSFSVWIKQFLGELQATSEISLMDHQAALTRHKVKCILLRGEKYLFITESSSILKGSKF